MAIFKRPALVSRHGAAWTMFPAAVLSLLLASEYGQAQIQGRVLPTLRADFFPEPKADPVIKAEVPPPSFEGKVLVRGPDGTWRSVPPPAPDGNGTPPPDSAPIAGGDVFLADGAENALAVNIGDGNNLVAVLNQGFNNNRSMKTSANGNVTWTTRTFPNGAGTYSGSPFDPWANPGNVSGRLFAMFERRDTASFNTHTVIARSTNNGVTWPLFFERTLNVFQDRAMFDVDRTAGLGGGPGSTHDGKIYMAYDDFGINAAGYVASRLQIVSPAGAALTELTISTSANLRGLKLQPVAGINDGQVYLMGLLQSGGGANRILRFHEVTGAGAATNLNISSMTFPSTGQQLGASARYGVNGHRINSHMFMDIDLTSGPRRGNLYVISNRNPNQGNPARDQGDVYLSVSTNGAISWSSTLIPGQAAGHTQFFSMMDVDDNGWIHVAYYQNETGIVNNGVLNASTANLYYTLSLDGGATWAPHIQINDPINTLDYFDPPLDLSPNFYLIGDYCQLKATGTCDATKVYVFWTGYDKDRTDAFVDDKRERVICTTITNLLCTGDTNRDNVVNVLDLIDVLLCFGQPAVPGCVQEDTNCDGTVNVLDLIDLLLAFGTVCP